MQFQHVHAMTEIGILDMDTEVPETVIQFVDPNVLASMKLVLHYDLED
jgi:hypothetical protein